MTLERFIETRDPRIKNKEGTDFISKYVYYRENRDDWEIIKDFAYASTVSIVCINDKLYLQQGYYHNSFGYVLCNRDLPLTSLILIQ